MQGKNANNILLPLVTDCKKESIKEPPPLLILPAEKPLEVLKDSVAPSTQCEARQKQKVLVPLILFALTVATTIVSGATFKGVNPFENPSQLFEGLPFSLTLLTILLSHEFGHFFVSQRHGVPVSLPYFIPAPPFITLGTFGAVIKASPAGIHKKALLDIGAAGPLAGFIIAVAATVIGLNLSEVARLPKTGEGYGLGSSIIFQILSYLVIGAIPENQGLVLHPIAFAGWIGFFITCINLLPIGQLDGGHIAYAVFGKRHRAISISMVMLLIIFGVFIWSGWLISAFLVAILFARYPYPPLTDDQVVLGKERRLIGWFSLVVFVVIFLPSPICHVRFAEPKAVMGCKCKMGIMP
jgi:membrane-associated protease RseP (regulator of RpoE activity)